LSDSYTRLHDTVRTFIAIDALNTNALENLQKELTSSVQWDLNVVKPIEKDSFHFTILFLGEIHKDIIERITEKLLKVEFESFDILYNNIGAFPNKNFPRIIWVGIDDDGKQKMLNLNHAILSKMEQEGFEVDKIFVPHLTLFRLKKRVRIDFDNLSNFVGSRTFGADIIDRFHLKRSDLTSRGPIYSNILTVYAK
jgi:2'-5' RNA ligase